MTQMDLLDWTPRYPVTPGAKAPGTSTEAAEAMRPRAGILRAKVLACLRRLGPLTADECADAMHETVLTIRPRFSELRALNQITDTGERRQNDSGRNAIVWRAA
jgi:predicted ArsR family transcriptional regulator